MLLLGNGAVMALSHLQTQRHTKHCPAREPPQGAVSQGQFCRGREAPDF